MRGSVDRDIASQGEANNGRSPSEVNGVGVECVCG